MTSKYDEELLRTLYIDEGLSVEDIALRTELNLRGIRSKLGSMGIYKKKGYVSKTGDKPIKKREIIDAIVPFLDVTVSEADSLEKVNKRVLLQISNILKNTQDYSLK